MRVDRRAAVAATVAFVLVAGTLALVLALGVTRPPDFPSLTAGDGPGGPGRVAYLNATEERTCLHVVDLSTAGDRELHCDPERAELAWRDDGTLRLRFWEPGAEVVFDPDTGEVLGADDVDRPAEPPEPLPDRVHDGTLARAGAEDGTAWVDLIAADRQRTRIVEVEAPERYRLLDARWSPTGRLLLLEDTEQRVLVVEVASGSVWVLAEHGHGAVWEPG